MNASHVGNFDPHHGIFREAACVGNLCGESTYNYDDVEHDIEWFSRPHKSNGYGAMVSAELDKVSSTSSILPTPALKSSRVRRRQAGGLPPLPPTALERAGHNPKGNDGKFVSDAEDQDFVVPLTRSVPRVDQQTQPNRNNPTTTKPSAAEPELPLCKPWKPPVIPFSQRQEYWVLGCVQVTAGLQCEPKGPFSATPTCRMPPEYNNACPWTESWMLAKFTSNVDPKRAGVVRVRGCAAVSITTAEEGGEVKESGSLKCGNNDSLDLIDALALPANPCFIEVKPAAAVIPEPEKDEAAAHKHHDADHSDRDKASENKPKDDKSEVSSSKKMAVVKQTALLLAAAAIIAFGQAI